MIVWWLMWMGCRGPAPEAPEALPGAVHLVTVEGLASDDPRLAPLAARGEQWQRAYLPSARLLPNVATLLTGEPPHGHGVVSEAHHRLPDTAHTLAEHARDAGWSTWAATSTLRTRRRFGLLQGFDAIADHRGANPVAVPLEPLLAGLPSPRVPHLFSWLHVTEPHLDDTLVHIDELLAVPGTTVVLVGVQTPADGLGLDDAHLAVPLIAVGPGRPAGRKHPAVVGLREVHAELRQALGLPPTTVIPLSQGGQQGVLHERLAAPHALGSEQAWALTLPEGRYRVDHAHHWFPAVDGRVADRGERLPGGDPHRAEQLAQARTVPGAPAPRAYGGLAHWRDLAVESPWVLADPDAPPGQRSAEQLREAVEALHLGARGLARKRASDVADALQAPGLADTPAATWLATLADWQQGRFVQAADHLERGLAHSDGPLFALLRARLALGALDRDLAIAWSERAVERAHGDPEALAEAAVVVALAKVPLGPLPPAESPDTVNTWAAELSAMNHPRAPLVAALLDPTSPTASDQVAAALAVDPTDADARLAAARVAWRGGDPVEGLAALRTLVREHPTHTVARVLLAAWDLELGHPEESLRLLGVVVRSRPDDEALEAWFREAQAAYTPADRQKRQVDRAFQRP